VHATEAVHQLRRYLQKLEVDGMSRQDIIDNHVFITAGACGPCRFGMYEAEYRLALRNSGFDGFRVMLFQQSGGLNQSEAGAGLDGTGQGRPIYLPLGFRDLYKIARWHFDGAKGGAVAPPAGVTIRPITPADLPRLAIYDRPLTGMERPSILMHLALRQPGRAWLAEDVGSKIVGFVLGREGRVATSLGPVVADRQAIVR